MTEQIVQLAKTILPSRLSEYIYLTLTDHLSFVFTRHKEGIELKNALLWEIKKFYQTEFEIGLRALEIIEKRNRY